MISVPATNSTHTICQLSKSLFKILSWLKRLLGFTGKPEQTFWLTWCYWYLEVFSYPRLLEEASSRAVLAWQHSYLSGIPLHFHPDDPLPLLGQSYHFLISSYLCPRVTLKNHHKRSDWKQGEYIPIQFWRPGFPSQGLGMVLLPPGVQNHPPLPLVASGACGCALPRLSCNSGLLPSTRGHVPGVSAKSASAFLIGGQPHLNSFNLIMSTKTLYSNQGAFTGSGGNYHAGGHHSTHYTLVFLSLGRSFSLENHALSSGNVPDLFIYF